MLKTMVNLLKIITNNKKQRTMNCQKQTQTNPNKANLQSRTANENSFYQSGDLLELGMFGCSEQFK